MKRTGALFRLLLCLALVLDGARLSHASPLMTDTHPTAESAAIEQVLPCHGHHDEAAETKGDPADHAAHHDSTSPHRESHDCCGSGSCDCVCAGQMPAAASTSWVRTIIGQSPVVSLQLDWPESRSPHPPDRPPIA
ncbi:MAG: CopL family metal-binding regulatory protein [Pseudomonadota bacterium]|nr:MAG: hypothetical protein DIU56_07165 [Pseudomonadota bacterium]